MHRTSPSCSSNALRGLAPDGSQDTGFHGRELARNAAVADLALATGLRLQEFTYLLPWEVPPLPPEPTKAPVSFPVPAAITKGGKFRVTWISYEALAAVHDYLELDRAATAEGSWWRPPPRWGEPLHVTEPGPRGGRVNGARRAWDSLTPARSSLRAAHQHRMAAPRRLRPPHTHRHLNHRRCHRTGPDRLAGRYH